jgi:hypothetical protein
MRNEALDEDVALLHGRDYTSSHLSGSWGLGRNGPELFYSRNRHQNLKRFRGARRRPVQKLINIIYDASGNQAEAKVLIEKILREL